MNSATLLAELEVYGLEVASFVILRGNEVGAVEWRRSGKGREVFLSYFLLFFMKNRGYFREGWWHKRNVASKKQAVLELPPATCHLLGQATSSWCT